MLALSAAHSNTLWTILSALGIILTVLATHLKARNDRNAKQDETNTKIEAVQETVNGTTHALTSRVDQLNTALTSAGVDIPASPTQLLADASIAALKDELRRREEPA